MDLLSLFLLELEGIKNRSEEALWKAGPILGAQVVSFVL